MVNGQTGKVVGAVPFDKKKAGLIFTLASLPLSALLTSVLVVCCAALKDDSFGVLLIALGVGALFWEFARRRWNQYLYCQGLTKEVEIQQFSKKRVGDDR